MLYQLTVPQFKKGLFNLSLLLEKAVQSADARKFSTEVLVNSRLAPDQFPFAKQVQIACDTAKLCVSRLTEKTAPVFEDNEKTFAELKTRIDQTVQFLNTLKEQDFAGAEAKKITTPRWEGKHLLGTEYVLQHAIPNFYFHITTAYAILRHNGVPIGKTDYLGELPFRS